MTPATHRSPHHRQSQEGRQVLVLDGDMVPALTIARSLKRCECQSRSAAILRGPSSQDRGASMGSSVTQTGWSNLAKDLHWLELVLRRKAPQGIAQLPSWSQVLRDSLLVFAPRDKPLQTTQRGARRGRRADPDHGDRADRALHRLDHRAAGIADVKARTDQAERAARLHGLGIAPP